MSKLNELKDQKVKILADATTILNRGLNTPTSKAQYEALLKQDTEISDTIQMLERIERSMPSLPVVSAPIVPVVTPESREQRRAKLNSAWREYLRGHSDQRVQEHRDIISSSDGGGGAVVPQEFSGFLSESLKYYAPLFDYANVRVSPNGRSVKVSRVNDTTHGLTLITEGSSTPVAEVDPGFSSSLVSTDLFTSGLTRFSNQLLSDSYFDLERLLTNLTSLRVGRGIETLLTLGTDSSSTSTPNNPGLINIAQTATTTATLAAGIGWADLIKTFDALETAYLAKAIWLMSSKTRNFLALQEDSTSRPYFVPAPNADGFDMLLGKPIVINNSLALPTTANGKPILFGSLFDGLQIVSSEVRVQTLVERFAEVNESAIIVSTRVGSASLQAGAIQALKLAAA